MKRKAVLLLVLLACCLVVSICTQSLQAAGGHTSHQVEAQPQAGDSPGLWQAILDGLAASLANSKGAPPPIPAP